MPEAVFYALGIVGVLLVMLIFAVGTQRNIRTGNRLVSWLQGGLPLLGKRATHRWLGSSAVQLEFADARPPLRTVQVVVALAPRDLALLWNFWRARGRSDLLILRARLRAAPLSGHPGRRR